MSTYIASGQNKGLYWPTDGWRTCTPEEAGMVSAKLNKVFEYAANPDYKVKSIVIVKDGYIVGEAYFGDSDITTSHQSASMAKSFTSALVGIAIEHGLVKGIDEKVCQYYQEWDCADEIDYRSSITLRHVMTLTTGLDWEEDWTPGYSGRNDTFEMFKSRDFLEFMLQRKGLQEPGTTFTYSTGDPMLLSGIIQKVSGMTAFEFAKKHLLEPIGICDLTWGSDPAGHTITFAGINAPAREYAKFGYLYLHRGYWDGKQLVPEQWVDVSTRVVSGVNGWECYGLLWHVNLPLRLEAPDSCIPSEGYMADGVGGQSIFVIPSKGLVIVKTASEDKIQMNKATLLELILDSVVEGNSQQ